MTDRSRRIAAIDIGTVTTRILVADVVDGSITELERSTDITHLGEGLAATGTLAPAAMERVREVIAGYLTLARALDVESIVGVATSASRDAANSSEFLGMLEEVGWVPEIISGTREAQLTFAGAAYGSAPGDILVDDIGGGSTELIAGQVASDGSSTLTLARSADVGSRRVSELFLGDDVATAAQLDRAREFVVTALRPIFDALPSGPRTLVSVAGTATSLVSIQLDMATYDAARVHGATLSGPDVSELLERLAGMTLSERRSVTGLHPDRASVIVAGTLILESILALAGVDSTMVSERDILYGIVLDASGRP